MSEHDDKQREVTERERQERERKEATAAKASTEAKRSEVGDEDTGDGGGSDQVESVGDGEATTKDDATDAGVPMLPGSPGEPQGPEDAFGEGLKRGDYADRVGTNQHAQSVPTEDGGEPVYGGEDGDEIVDVKPRSTLVSQNDRVDEVGDEAGEKGGVTTTA